MFLEDYTLRGARFSSFRVLRDNFRDSHICTTRLTAPARAPRARKYLGRCATAASKPSVGRLRLSVSLSAGPFRIWSCAAAHSRRRS